MTNAFSLTTSKAKEKRGTHDVVHEGDDEGLAGARGRILHALVGAHGVVGEDAALACWAIVVGVVGVVGVGVGW